jgi:D-beta-D-heptose 7-phosphate kinase/D-beta-D-heptose 1-phosphate adenosyltransferase
MNVALIGDVMLDVDILCDTNRKATEADIPIYSTNQIIYKLGGAANVSQNLQNLKINHELISVIGNDESGKQIKNLLLSNKITHKLLIDDKRQTTHKNRIINNNTICVRYDIENTNSISTEQEETIFEYLKSKQNLHAIIISDYNKGVITERLCKNIIEYANKNEIFTFVDPKIENYLKYVNCFCIKPNRFEAEAITLTTNIKDILINLKNSLNCENIILTSSEEGIYVFDNKNNLTEIKHNSEIQAKDVVGAGDIVLSVLVCIHLNFKDLLLAAQVANYVAGKKVQTVGNYCLMEFIKEYFSLFSTSVSIEKIHDTNKIIYDFETIKIQNLSNLCTDIVFTNGCFDILHSAHIKLLKFAKNLGSKLVVGLNSDQSIRRLKGSQRPINNLEERSTILSLLDFVDNIIIFGDDTPINIIKQLKPHYLVKGGDYKKENLKGAEYVKEVVLFDFIENKSTTSIVSKIKNIK